LKRQLTVSERLEVDHASAAALDSLRRSFAEGSTENDLDLLQKWFDDGGFAKTRDLTNFGFAWGNIIAQEIGANWVVAEFEGTEYFGLNVPMTTITVAPIAMLEKRQDRDDRIDFREFLSNTVDAVRKMEENPEYQRPPPE
jgi:hypothetical protein